MICVACLNELESAYLFRQKCLKSHVLCSDAVAKHETDTPNEQSDYKDLNITQNVCDMPSENAEESKLTEDIKDNKETFKCFHCDSVFTNKTLIRKHIQKTHGLRSTAENSEQHNDNSDKSSDKSEENQPADATGDRKSDPNSKTCCQCGVTFNTKYLLKRHVKNVHALEKNYKCDTCGQKFASPVYLSAHKKYHLGERHYICSTCGKGYITASDLYHHEKIHANKRAYRCEKCPKAFNTSSDLHKHRICVHVDRSQWKYVCEHCQRRFPLKTNLDTHVKTHTGERNFACHLCSRKCINRSVLQRHIESHSNVRSFKCSVCCQEYKYQKSLDIHMMKAHGTGNVKVPERTKKHVCHICFKSYFANNKLQRHIRSHSGEKPFVCQVCEKGFVEKSFVKQHLRTIHNVTLDEDVNVNVVSV